MSLRISEIFHSLQGESLSTGLRTVFVRLTGCPLRCQYCDTEYAFSGGEQMSQEQIMAEVANWQVDYVCVTGGEPLAQPNCLPLLRALCDQGYQVSLETSGALDVSEVDPRVSKVLDIKTPGSKEVQRNRWENLAHLGAHDQIKFVICDQQDYQWARMKLDEHQLANIGAAIWFSPSYEQVALADLAQWVLDDRLPVRVQVQLHKVIWGDEPGR